MNRIMLQDIWSIPDTDNFKIHFARFNGHNQPLDVWVRDLNEWQKWQEYRPGRDDFNRPLIFALMQFYHKPDTWLFGGVWRVKQRHAEHYKVELTEHGSSFLGRLKLKIAYADRSTRVKLENHYHRFEVDEILREPYSGRVFPGFENIDISFEELEALIRNNRYDWMAALTSIKGIYMISDKLTGKQYIGSAYGAQGIWSRWASYAANGHGGNIELLNLVTDPTLNYCREAFKFTLLESRSSLTPDEVIIERGTFWKEALLSRQYGLNRN